MSWWVVVVDMAKSAAQSPAVKLAIARRILEKFKKKKAAEASK